MDYGLELNNSSSIEQTLEASENVSDSKLVESEEFSEDFDDCGVNEVSEIDESEKINADSIEIDDENYDDCLIEEKANEVLALFKQNNWENITVREQKEAIEKLASYNAEILGIENPPAVVYYRSDDITDFGGYSSAQHTIYINESNMGDAVETADTISHEYRHCYQHERAEKLETEIDLAFKESFDNYVSPENDYAGYRNQLVEKDAREYAEVIKEKIASMGIIEASGMGHQKVLEGEATSYEALNPEKGAVFEQIRSDEFPHDFKKKIVEVSEANEIFEEKELREIKDRVLQNVCSW